MNTTRDTMARIMEAKSLVRHVRTRRGAKRFGQPIGSIIVRDLIPNATKRRKSRNPKKTPVSMARNDTHIDAAAVAPESDTLPGKRNLGRKVSASARHRGWKNDSFDLHRNKAQMRKDLNVEFMKQASADDAAELLDELGVEYDLEPMFRTNRDFMVGLAVTLEAFENQFPGFVYRHGHIFSDSSAMDSDTIAYNQLVRRVESDEEIDHPANEDFQQTNNAYVGIGYEYVPRRDASQTATVVNPYFLFRDFGIITERNNLATVDLRTREQVPGYFSSNDFMFDEKYMGVSMNTLAAIQVLTHEFGHAIAASIKGQMSFEVDGWEDPDQWKRRWYTEYYADTILNFFEEMGLAKRTGKKPDASMIQYLSKDHEGMHDHSAHALFEESLGEDARDLTDEELKKMLEDGDYEAIKAFRLARQKFRRENGGGSSIVDASTPRRSMAEYLAAFNRDGYIEDGYDPSKFMNIVSGYANKNWNEFEAEAFSSFMLDTEVSPAAQMWGQVMSDMFRWWTEDDMDPEFGQNNEEGE